MDLGPEAQARIAEVMTTAVTSALHSLMHMANDPEIPVEWRFEACSMIMDYALEEQHVMFESDEAEEAEESEASDDDSGEG